MKKNKKGFTLVEIIVVLVILAILAAIAIPTVLGYVDDAKEARELAKLRESLIAAQVTFVKSAASGENGQSESIGGIRKPFFFQSFNTKTNTKIFTLAVLCSILIKTRIAHTRQDRRNIST